MNVQPSLAPDDLFQVDPSAYSDKYCDHLFEQYKLYVQSHEKISERREGANKFFLALNSAVVAAISFFLKPETRSDLFILFVTVGAIAICVFWYRAIRSYDNLNTGKFQVIHAIEKRLPLAPYKAEWKALGEGKNPAIYKPISHLERSVPLIFGAVYVALATSQLASKV